MLNMSSLAKHIKKHCYLTMCLFFIGIGLFYLTCALAITIIPQYKQQIANQLSQVAGQRVDFSRIKFQWQGFRVYAKVYDIDIGKKDLNRSSTNQRNININHIASVDLLLQPVRSLFSLKPKFDRVNINGGTVYLSYKSEDSNLDNIELKDLNLKNYLSSILNQPYFTWINIDKVTLNNIEIIATTLRQGVTATDSFVLVNGSLKQTTFSTYIHGLAYKINSDKVTSKAREKIELAIKFSKIKKSSSLFQAVNHKFYFATNSSNLLKLLHDIVKNKVKDLHELTIDQDTEIKLWGEINNTDFASFDLAKKLLVQINSPRINLNFSENKKLELLNVHGLVEYKPKDFAHQDVFSLAFENFKTTVAGSEFLINAQLSKSGALEPIIVNSDINFGFVDFPKFVQNLPGFIIGSDTHKWLIENVHAGKLGMSKILLRGPLDNSFPYDPKHDKPNGIVNFQAELLNTDLSFSSDWPMIHNMDAMLTIRGRSLNIASKKATFNNSQIVDLSADIKDLGTELPNYLSLHGKLKTSGDDLAKIIATTPLKNNLGGVNQHAKFTGPIGLDLNLNIPLAMESNDEIAVSGKLFFNRNNLDIIDTPLKLNNVSGVLNFTDQSADSTISAEYNKKPAKIALNYKNSLLNIVLNGWMDSRALLDYYQLDLHHYLSGDTEFNLTLNLPREQNLNIVINSNLQGVTTKFPKIYFDSKLNKLSADTMASQFIIDSDLGTDGLTKYSLRIPGKNTNFDYTKNSEHSTIAINSPDIVGNINLANQVVNADFNKLAINVSSDVIADSASSIDFYNLANMNVSISNFIYNHQSVGKLKFSTDSNNKAKTFIVNNAGISGDALDLNFTALYKNDRSNIDGKYKIKDLPKVVQLIDDSSFKDMIKLDGAFNLSWPNDLFAVELNNLIGDLSIISGHGRITDVKLGIGRLFGFLNLQSLDKRLRFDFSDVFESGFKFDNVRGKFNVAKGVLSTDKTKISAGSADVELYGDVDLIGKNYDMKADVTPHITSSLPVAAAVVGTPVAGAVVFLVDKILESPVDQLSERSYSVTGPWSDPVITKLKRKRGPLIEVSWLKKREEIIKPVTQYITDIGESLSSE